MDIEKIKELGDEARYLMAVPALKGHMGGVDYFVITLPYSVLVRYVTTTDRNLPPRERENRKPTPARYRDICDYITCNPEGYRFSSITCTYGKDGTHGPVSWKSPEVTGDLARLGILTLDQRDPLIIVDGQHRYEAIKKALEVEQSLADDMVSIVLFPYVDLRTAQQLFSDLNRTAKKTTKSLDILFDYRDVKNRVTQELVARVSVFKDRVNLEDAGIPAQSSQVFTLAGVYQATEPLIDAIYDAGLITEELAQRDSDGKPLPNEDEYVQMLSEIWEFIAAQLPEWGKVANGELDIKVVRTQYIHWNSAVVSAIGELVAAAIREKGQAWRDTLAKALTHPENRGWRRDESHWQGIATAGTLVLPRSVLKPQLKAYLKNLSGLSLTEGDEKNLESIQKRKKELKEL